MAPPPQNVLAIITTADLLHDNQSICYNDTACAVDASSMTSSSQGPVMECLSQDETSRSSSLGDALDAPSAGLMMESETDSSRLQSNTMHASQPQYAPHSSSDAAMADALSCSLADIAGSVRDQRHLSQQATTISESTKTTETSSSHNETSSDDPEQQTSVVAVTGSTTNSERDDDVSASQWATHRPRVRKHRDRDTSTDLAEHQHAVVVASALSATEDLLEPGKEPALHTIRRTMNRVMQARRHDSSEAFTNKHRKRKASSSSREQSHMEAHQASDRAASENASSSGSGTEAGYAGSASANEDHNGSSSPSVSSSDDSHRQTKARRSTTIKGAAKSTSDPRRPMLSNKQDSNLSSDLADFGSSSSENEMSESFLAAFAPSPSPCRSPSISSDSQDDDCEQAAPWPPVPFDVSDARRAASRNETTAKIVVDASDFIGGKPAILSVGCDIMAHVLTFLEPPDILDVLTMPLSKDWLFSFTRQPELWRVLCLLEPFKAQVDSHGNESSDDSDFCGNVESELRVTFGKHRLLYTSFVRCMKYLTRIKDDAVNGRPPSVIDYGSGPATFKNIETNQNLKEFLARARGIAVSDNSMSDHDLVLGMDIGKLARRRAKVPNKTHRLLGASELGLEQAIVTRKRRKSESDKTKHSKKKKKVTYGHSILTQRILGPTADGTAGTAVELPWSCAIYSIVNWMVAFSDVEGMQTMCMKVLPSLLDDEQQRLTAQRAGLTDIIFRAMVMFPDSSDLHTAACHTIVLLARPLGGREGMLFHTSMVNSSGIFSIENGGAESGRNGIAVLLDSMRRFRENEALQAMSCWSLVNVALAPAQKEMLVRLGAIEVTAAAMQTHPFNAEVQFRALFALVNLVIPSVSLNNDEGSEQRENSSTEDSSERDILDENVGMIVQLVVQSMKNFCASEAILNRACLVLHNLSLTQDYHNDLLWTPNCYQMLEWCLANYPSDQVLQQSAAGTLHRLQITLSGDEGLRSRFMASLQSQQQLSLEQAHREAGALHTQVTAAAP